MYMTDIPASVCYTENTHKYAIAWQPY